MRFDHPLIPGTLLRRYKRFLADVQVQDGRTITVHVPNTGSMLGCAEPNSAVALSHHPGKGRKLAHTLELVRVDDAWVGVNTSLPNHIAEESIRAGRVGPLRGYPELRREVKYAGNSRIDILLSRGDQLCYVEVKNVTLRPGRSRRALFPDSITERGTRHLLALREMAQQGHRAVMFFLVNRTDCTSMAPADAIDPIYSETLREVAEDGVELLAYRTDIDLSGIRIARKVPVRLEL